jgi:putative sterol carrier protein
VPKTDAQYVITVQGGAVSVTPASGDAALVWTLVPGDAEAVQNGELDLNVAFMQGRVKAAGDNALLLQTLRAAPRVRHS